MAYATLTNHWQKIELQTAKQTLTTSKILVEFTYGDFGLPLPSEGEQK